MPKKLAAFDFKATDRRDWGPLLDGSIWVLNKGEDFDGDPQKFAYQVRSAARRAGTSLKVSADSKAGTVTFQAGEKLAVKPSKPAAVKPEVSKPEPEDVKPTGVLKKPAKK